ncbi:MAG: signal recognition particle-docking protein FtsY [Alphaproteobacteria bacterium]|jgi:fused signal recognition particle receptor
MSWFERLKKGLTKTSSKLTQNVVAAVDGRKLDQEAIEQLEDALIMSDMGPSVAAQLIESLDDMRGRTVSDTEVRERISQEVTRILERVAEPIDLSQNKKPFVILVIGVNGTGKTTTIGKLASALKNSGEKVMIAAGDTFRAAAVEQLQIWGERAGVPVVTQDKGSDAASLAFEAIQKAKDENIDVLLIDTAGRLHNKSNLMDELKKIVRVIKKIDPSAPHETLLTLDATTGQNALSQVKVFGEMANVTGLALTKLDGTAKGGVVISLAKAYDIPVRLIGVGEGQEDMQPFQPREFARGLLGL